MTSATKIHTNPDGSAVQIPETATVAAEVHVGPLARIRPRATILGGTILGGTIWGGTIRGGTIRGGTIWGGTIRGGTIWGDTIQGGTILGGTIWGGTILGGTIRGGTIRGGTIRSTRDVVTAGPVGAQPSLLTAVPNDDRDGWLVVGGCSEAIPLDLADDTDPFIADYPCTEAEAAERLAALTFLRLICAGRSL